MKNNIYVLNQRQDETFDAAGKAMRDVFSVLADKKAKIIWSVPKHCSRFSKRIMESIRTGIINVVSVKSIRINIFA